MSLHIYLLGSMRVLHGKTLLPETVWKTQKNKSLFKILLTYRGRALIKDQLLEWLWPEITPAAANRNLRVAISQLRQVLEPGRVGGSGSNFIMTTDSGYAWNLEADYTLDVDEFQARCTEFEKDNKTATAEQARALYQGDYLEEDRYADWVAAPREQLRERYLTLLTQLSEAYAWQGRYRRAIALCRELLTADRVRETAWRQLILYYYHGGDHALALRAYDECRQALSEELGVEPLPDTAALAEQVRRQKLGGESGYPPPAATEHLGEFPVSLGRMPFLGREREFATLTGIWERARQGEGGICVVEGEAGIGKTRLVRELLSYVTQQGGLVLEGQCRELERTLPYQPLIDAIRSAGEAGLGARALLDAVWRAELAHLLPEWSLAEVNPLPVDQDSGRLFEALLRYLSVLAKRPQQAGLVLFLDDLHWADQTTLQFFAYLGNRLASTPIFCVVTVRPEEFEPSNPVPQYLQELDRTGRLRRLSLQPLGAATVTLMIHQVSHASPEAARIGRRLYDETQGHPLFLVALLHTLFEVGLLNVDDQGRWFAEEYLARDSAERVIPNEVCDLIRARVRQLDSRTQRLLGLAAVVGRPFTFPLLQRASGVEENLVLDALDYMIEHRWLRTRETEGERQYDLSHDLVRWAIYQTLSPDRRALFHRKLLGALEDAQATPTELLAGELAYHAMRGHVWSTAPGYCHRAALAALDRYALPEALQHCENGLAALDAGKASLDAGPQQLTRYDLLTAKQLALHLTGHRDQGVLDQLMQLARAIGDRERLAQAYYALMRHYIDTGQNRAALDLLPQYSPIVSAGISPAAAIGFHQRVGFLHYRVGDLDRALEHHDNALHLSQGEQDTHWQAYVLNSRGNVLLCLGRYEEAIVDWTRAIDLWDGPARRLFRTFALDNRADVYHYVGRYEEELAAKVEALPVYREFGYRIAEAECLSEIGGCLRALGRMDEAESYLRQALALSRSLQDSYDLVQTLNGLALLCLEKEHPADWRLAAEYARQGATEAESAVLPHGVIQGLAYQATAALRLGLAEDALDLSSRAVALLEGRRRIEGAEEEIYWIHSQVLAANGRTTEARQALDQAWDEMMTKANRLNDTATRHSFLERVRVNCAIRTAMDQSEAVGRK